MYFSKKMIDIQSIVTNGVITFSSRRVRSIGTYPARNLNKNRKNRGLVYLDKILRRMHATMPSRFLSSHEEYNYKKNDQLKKNTFFANFYSKKFA